MGRIHNFSAGPCTLPVEALESAAAELVEFGETGMSIIEMSHRSQPYEEVHNRCISLAEELFAVPDGFDTLILQGGATLQFSMVPMNLLAEGKRAAYVDSGAWATKALADAQLYGDAYAAWSGADDYTRMPGPDELEISGDTRYLHVTSNETINGIRMTSWPDVDVPLVADMSSDYMSRPIPWDLFDLVYGGAQKNLGPAGATLVFVRKRVVEGANKDIGAYLRYASHAAKDSLYNTPPVFSIYMMGKVLQWMADEGGVAEMERRAAERAQLVYDAIEQSEGFYTSPVELAARSHMNVVFRLPSEDLEAVFVSAADERGFSGLKGHRAVGGVRASMYNAMSTEGVGELVGFMEDFAEDHR